MSKFENQFAMRCPQCLQTDRIDVAATVCVRLVPDGTDADLAEDGDHDWNGDSGASCGCGFRGTVADFRTYQCQNCLMIHNYDKLKPIKRYHERVAEGEEAPASECPECGSLCQTIEDSDGLMSDTPDEDPGDDIDDGGVEDVEVQSLPGDER